MTVLSTYNDYIWPLVVISDTSLQTFSVGVTKFAGEYNLDYGPTLAGYVRGSIPLLILFADGMEARARWEVHCLACLGPLPVRIETPG